MQDNTDRNTFDDDRPEEANAVGSTVNVGPLLDRVESANATLKDSVKRLEIAQEAQARLFAKLETSGDFLDRVSKAESILHEFFEKLRAHDLEISDRQKGAEASRQAVLKNRLDPIENALRSLDERLGELSGRLAGATTGMGELEATRRLPLGYRVSSWAGALMIVAVGLGLLTVIQLVYRQAVASGLDRDRSQSTLIAARLDQVEDRARSMQVAADQVRDAAQGLQSLRPRHEELAESAGKTLRQVEASRAAIDGLVRTLKNEAAANKAVLENLGDQVARDVSRTVNEAVTRPVESNKVAIDTLSGRFEGLRTLLKKPARPERTALVLFNSMALKAETCKAALERLFLETPLRWGYDGYQIALFLSSNGALQKGGNVVPFGPDPAPSAPFQVAWTTEAGSGDDFQKFDPKALFSEVPEGVARRCVLVVGPAVSPPKRDDPRWPKSVRVHALIVGKCEKDRLKDWDDFCKDHGGGAREVAPETDKLQAEMIVATEPQGRGR